METRYLLEPATASAPASLWDYSDERAADTYYQPVTQVMFEDGSYGMVPSHLVERLKNMFGVLAGEF